MKMKLLAITLLLVLFSLTGQAKEHVVVWEHPATERNVMIEGFFQPLLEVKRVEFCTDETRLTLHVSLRPEESLSFATSSHLVSEGENFALKRLEGMTPDQDTHLTEKGYADLVFHFEPLPKGTRRFDFFGGNTNGAFRIFGIEDKSTRAQRLFPSLWRSERTGCWELALYDDFAIYDCRFWNYKHREQNGDKFDIVLENEGREVSVLVGKNKDGRRTITIDGAKDIYSPITSISLTDYPTKDTNTSFKDTNYTPDTVTFVGWLKDMPKWMKERGPEFKVSAQNIFSNESEKFSGQIDSLGRFSVKVPVIGPTEVYYDWERTFVHMPFEPGETYFLLYDLGEGHKLIMGKNSRLQNEILAAPIRFTSKHPEGGMDEVGAMRFLEDVKQAKQNAMALLGETQVERPNISARYVRYLTDYYNTTEGRNLMQGQYYMKRANPLPAEYLRYVDEHHWQHRTKPYTLYEDFSGFYFDYISQLESNKFDFQGPTYRTGLSIALEPYLLRRNRAAGKLSVTDEEIALTERHIKAMTKAMSQKTEEDVQQALKKLNDQDETQQYLKFHNSKEVQDMWQNEQSLIPLYRVISVLDSLNCDQTFRDIVITNNMLNAIDHSRMPLDDGVVRFFDENVQMPVARNILHETQEKYLALSRKDISNNPSLRKADDLSGITDGEQLLRKLTEPYRGKMILIDVWGTWCGPCKEALSESEEEYERLKDYDLVYLYLCNRSSDDSWKAVIKQYDLLGDNIVHYNLPDDQQASVERFLGVKHFPTYKLIDREGKVIDVEVDARDLDELVKVLNQMK